MTTTYPFAPVTAITGQWFGLWPYQPIHVGLSPVTGPAVEPFTIAEAKQHLRIDVTDEDGGTALWIAAARAKVEQDTGRALLTQTWDQKQDRFPLYRGVIDVRLPPLQSVTSITYYDTANTLQTMASSDYIVDSASFQGRIGLTDNASWPGDVRQFQPAAVRFVAGWTSPTAIPPDLRHAMALLIGHFSECRVPNEDGRFGELRIGDQTAYDALIGNYRLHPVG